MNKLYIDALIVVEGKSDASFLSSFIDSSFFITNGFDLSYDKIEFLKHASKSKQILLMLDPDEAGLSIEKKLIDLIGNVTVIHVEKSQCNKNNKHGVAECNINEIIRVLSPFASVCMQKVNLISLSDFLSITCLENGKIEKIKHFFHIGKCNTKTTVKRLNVLGVQLEDLKKVIEDGN